MESLKNALTSVGPAEVIFPAPYITEAWNEYGAEVELYLLGEQDLDKTMKNTKERVQAVVDANK